MTNAYPTMSRTLLTVILFVAVSPFLIETRRIKNSIYVPLNGMKFCFRRTNGTHEVGCQSRRHGNVGVVHLIADPSDIDWMMDKGPHGPYIAAFVPRMFTRANLERVREVIDGVLLLPVIEDNPLLRRPEAYSADGQCPNAENRLDPDEECNWNEVAGQNIMNEDWEFPIFLVDDKNTTEFLMDDCYEKFNKPTEDGSPRDWPLCAVEMKAHMFAAVDTTTCIRRSTIINNLNPTYVCDKLGDKNIFAFLKDRNGTSDSESPSSVIALTTRLDSFTMFSDAEHGADSPSLGIVSLLLAANLIFKNSDSFGPNADNLLFGFFNGETFGYIGSSRFSYDMSRDEFPNGPDPDTFSNGQQPLLKHKQLKVVVEVGQLFDASGNRDLFLHADSSASAEFVRTLEELGSQHSFSVRASSKAGLPPSSLQSLLKDDRQVPGVLVSNYDKAFSNKYYHSLYDDASNVGGYDSERGENQRVVKQVSEVAELLAEFVQRTSGGSGTPFTANATLANELLKCYLETADCPLFRAALTPDFQGMRIPDFPWPQYVGVDRKGTPHTVVTQRLFAYLTGEVVQGEFDHNSCRAPDNQDVYTYYFMKGESVPSTWNTSTPCNDSLDCGHCIRTNAMLTTAISPAFVIDGYDFANATYSAWAESIWKEHSGRIFLKAAPSLEYGHFACGVIMLLVSFGCVWWIDRFSAVIFAGAVDASATNGEVAEPTAL